MGLQGYALPSHENIGTAPFTSAPGLTLDGIQSVRDLTDISPVVQSHEDAVMPNALFRTPIRQPLTDYTEARFPTGAFEYHKSQKERIPTHQEDFDLRFQTSSAVDNHLFDLQKMTRDQWSTDIQDSRIVMKHGRPVHVKYDQLSGTDQIVGDVWNPEHYNVGLAPFQNDLQHTLTTPGLAPRRCPVENAVERLPRPTSPARDFALAFMCLPSLPVLHETDCLVVLLRLCHAHDRCGPYFHHFGRLQVERPERRLHLWF